MVKFDRFPEIEGPTPDFIAYFRTPYALVGEHIKTFRKGSQGQGDVKQLVAYSRWNAKDGNVILPHDVAVFVDVFSDDVAAEQMQSAWSASEPSCPRVPVVILGYSRDSERASGEWYKCKWRKHVGNRAFSVPNVCADAKKANLNSLFVGSTLHAIPVDKHALDLTKRNPLVNDSPPALYSLVRLVYPALFELLTDEERDQLQADERVIKMVSRDTILASNILSGIGPRPKVVQDALDFLVSPLDLASRDNSDPPQYSVTIDMKQFGRRDWNEFLSEKAARALVRKLKVQALGRRRSSTNSGQGRLFE